MAVTPTIVSAVVVTYFPDVSLLCALLQSLLPQVQKIVVVDNTPESDGRIDTLRRTLDDGRIHLFPLGKNYGIAHALNVGIDVAMNNNSTHVLLSDQDSVPAPDMVANLFDASAKLTAAGMRVAAVGPAFTDRHTGRTFPFQAYVPGKFFYGHLNPSEECPCVEAISIITSGSLISCQVLRDVGLMRGDFFIDNVDVEWCHRARIKGFSLFGVGTAKMYHSLGDKSLRIWYFGWRQVSLYAPLRIYYSIRNFVQICGMRSVVWHWKLRNAWYLLGLVYSHAVFGSQRMASLRMALRGLWDGLRGRMGPWHG